MVQTKGPHKFAIQADQAKPITHKANTDQKKMKKSKPTKRSEFETAGTRSFTREVPQPGKPPTLDIQPSAAATPQEQYPIKASPNYMKPTSSFKARRERSQVSSCSSKNLIKTSSNPKALTRTSSSKLVRTLTKSPSFKPVRASTKKCSQVVLREDLNVQRPTCSSTLKDSKFPTYLELSSGATESEGTSAMKVCPYTYCSLNGHRHAPLPPLKCFLAARRGMLKAQKKEMIIRVMPVDEKPAVQEMGSNSSAVIPLIQEDQMGFFIEIYVDDAEDAAETTGGSKQNGENKDETCIVANGNFEAGETDSEISNMEWEEGQYSAQSPDGVGSSDQTNVEYGFQNCSFYDDDDNPSSHYQSIFSSNFEDISAEEGPAEVFEEEGTRSGAGCSNGGSDSEGSFQNLASDESIQVFDNENYQVLTTYDVFEESTTEERYGNAESDGFEATMITSTATEERIQEPREGEAREDENKVLEADEELSRNNLLVEDDKTESTSNVKDEAVIYCQENESIEDDEARTLLEIQEQDSAHSFAESHKDVTFEDHNSSDSTAVYQSDYVPETEDSKTNKSLKEELPTADDTDGMEKKQENAGKSPIRIPTFDLLQGSSEAEEDKTEEAINEIQLGATATDGESNQALASEVLPAETQVHSSEKKSQSINADEDQNQSEKDCHEDQPFKTTGSMDSEDQTRTGLKQVGENQKANEDIDETVGLNHVSGNQKANEDIDEMVGLNQVSVEEKANEYIAEMVVQYPTMSEPEESYPSAKNEATTQAKPAFCRGGGHSSQELPKSLNNLRIIRCKGSDEDLEDTRKFNPREPNYLFIEPDPEAEKVDLRHLSMDETKNAEEWMLDYALRQAVTKLAPARKRKVALLVEAFEKVIPIPKYKSHPSHTQAAFAHARPIQACS